MINRCHAIHGLHSRYRFADHLLRRTSISLEETIAVIKFIFIRIPLALTFPKVKVSNIKERIFSYHLRLYFTRADSPIISSNLLLSSESFNVFTATIRISFLFEPTLLSTSLSPFFFLSFRFREKFYVPLEETAKDKIVSRVLVSNFHGFARNPVINHYFRGTLLADYPGPFFHPHPLSLSFFLPLYASPSSRLTPLFLYTSQISLPREESSGKQRLYPARCVRILSAPHSCRHFQPDSDIRSVVEVVEIFE